MEVLKVYLEEQLMIKYYMIKHLIQVKIKNMIDIKELNFFDKLSAADKGTGIDSNSENQQLLEKLPNHLIKSFKYVKLSPSFKTTFGVQI